MSLLVAGLKFPLLASGLGVAWLVFRVVYMFGYVRRDKTKGQGRVPGLMYGVPQLGLAVLSGLVGWGMISA